MSSELDRIELEVRKMEEQDRQDRARTRNVTLIFVILPVALGVLIAVAVGNIASDVVNNPESIGNWFRKLLGG